MAPQSKWTKPDLPDFTHDSEGNELCVDNDTSLRPQGANLPLTKKHIREIQRCAESPRYFIENYLKIIHPDEGVTNLILREYQKRFIKHIHDNRHSCNLLPRQVGKTTMVAAYLIWYMIFNESKLVALLAHKLQMAEEIMFKIQTMYRHLPKWLQMGVVQASKRRLVLENQTRAMAESTSGGAAAGLTVNILYLDEFALVKTHIAETFIASAFPTVTVSKNSKIIITSTPRGYNHFHTLYAGDNEFAAFCIEWDEPPGRDEEFKKKIIAAHGEKYWNQEYAAQFEGSSTTLIEGRYLKTIQTLNPIETRFEDKFRIYEMPIPGHAYIIGSDVAQGLGGDASAMSVIDVTASPFKQVAAYSSNTVRTVPFAALLQEIGMLYNDAAIIVENNGPGLEVAEMLWDDFEYEKVIRWDRKDGVRAKKPGIVTNNITKTTGCLRLKDYVETHKFLLQDMPTVTELWSFIPKGQSWKAEQGKTDDLIMANVVAFFFTTLDIFSDYVRDPHNFLTDVMGDEIGNIEDEMASLFAASPDAADQSITSKFTEFGMVEGEMERIDMVATFITEVPRDNPVNGWRDRFYKYKGPKHFKQTPPPKGWKPTRPRGKNDWLFLEPNIKGFRDPV